MPPPPPNFLPASRRQHLDPTRHLKSRELWNQVRFHASASRHSTKNNNSQQPGAGRYDVSNLSSNAKWAMSLFQAITYEIQPFRIRPCLHRAKIFIFEEEGLKQLSTYILEHAKSIFSFLQTLSKSLHQLLQQTDIDSLKSFFLTNKSLLAKSTTLLFALRIYYHVLLYLHDLLHAGPIIVILTLLTLLYTIGLGDNTGAASGIPSAYSVFNRGMQRIMGTVDGEELARQYAGGAMMAGMNNRNDMNRNGGNDDFEDDGDVLWGNEEEEEEEEERNMVNERRRRRRLERLQQQQQQTNNEGGNENDNEVEQQPPPPQEEDDGEAPHRNENHEIMDEDDDAPDLADTTHPTTTNETAGAATAATGRKSGKKSRRRNLELRREMQRQRQAAAAMGFGGDMEINENDGRELEARMDLE